MEPQNLRFGGGVAATTLHPFVAVELVLAVVLVLLLPRRWAGAPILWIAFTVPLGQVVVLGGIHFTVLRIIILAGLARTLRGSGASPEGRFSGGLNCIDKYVILWAASELIVDSVQFMEAQALIANLGNFLDLLGGYLTLRFLIQDRDDVRWTIRVFVFLCLVNAVCMINEQLTGRNVFGLLGGAPLFSQVREGKIRSQGAFGVYIEAGIFGANLIPLFVWLWSDGRARGAATLGIIGATTMVITCNSSTPLLGYAAAILGFCLWPLRGQMRLIRRTLAATLIGLHVVMKAPVWSLIARIDLTGSSSGYHRYYLVDNCIRHFSDWWLLGYKDYANWGWDMWDLSNLYVSVALTGGLISLIFFISILNRTFVAVGTARRQVEGNLKEEWFVWCLGCALFADVVSWFGLSCWPQSEQALSALLACIGVAAFEPMRSPEVQAEVVETFSLRPGEIPALT
jgi:hypothetical protein